MPQDSSHCPVTNDADAPVHSPSAFHFAHEGSRSAQPALAGAVGVTDALTDGATVWTPGQALHDTGHCFLTKAALAPEHSPAVFQLLHELAVSLHSDALTDGAAVFTPAQALHETGHCFLTNSALAPSQ